MSYLKTLALSCCLVFITGCVSTEDKNAYLMPEGPVTHSAMQWYKSYRPTPDDVDSMRHSGDMRPRHPQATHKPIADYADQLAMGLMDRAVHMTPSHRMAIASFVRFDETLRHATVIGNRLSEAMITAIQSYGISVVDSKLTGELAIGKEGDLVFSRNPTYLSDELSLDYILSGTLIERVNGIEVNARILSVKDQRVAATSRVFIPDYIVASETSPIIGL